MSNPSPFKWRHFEAEIILLCVRWYLRYAVLATCAVSRMMRSPTQSVLFSVIITCGFLHIMTPPRLHLR
jgi:transposase-like protein